MAVKCPELAVKRRTAIQGQRPLSGVGEESNLRLLSHLQSIINLYSEVPYGTLDLGMAQ